MFFKCFRSLTKKTVDLLFSIKVYSKVVSKNECSIFCYENQTKPCAENTHVYILYNDDYIVKVLCY